jgi:hypothetical protein
MAIAVHSEQTAVGGHQLGGQQIVDRETVLADTEADTAAQRAPDPDRAGVTKPGGEAAGSGSRRVFARRQPRLGPGGASLAIDVERPHLREVEHDPTFRGAIPGVAVAAAADRQLEARVARERDDARHVAGVRRPDDGRRPVVEPAEEHGTCLVVGRVIRGNHTTVEVGAELRYREVSRRPGHGRHRVSPLVRSPGFAGPVV